MNRDINYLNKSCSYLDIIEVSESEIIVRSLKPYDEAHWDCDCNYFIEQYSTSIEEEQEASYSVLSDRLAIIHI